MPPIRRGQLAAREKPPPCRSGVPGAMRAKARLKTLPCGGRKVALVSLARCSAPGARRRAASWEARRTCDLRFCRWRDSWPKGESCRGAAVGAARFARVEGHNRVRRGARPHSLANHTKQMKNRELRLWLSLFVPTFGQGTRPLGGRADEVNY